MHRLVLTGLVLALFLVAPVAAAHGDLEINELETLVIRDFEGGEESFPWEGFEIWDVYAGEGYNDSLRAHGVYFKVNFGGDGTLRPTGGAAWTVTFSFRVGDEAFERQFTHDGTTITTSFESFQWQVADGNVLQVKAWVPVVDWAGRSITDIQLVSSVDGAPRDTAPGGIHDPVTGAEIPVEAPSTPIFPPLGEGRIVDEVPLVGPAKYIDLAIASNGNNTFTLTVTNVLKEQGQHVMLDADDSSGWTLTTASPPHSLDGGKTATFDVQIHAAGEPGATLPPYEFNIITDIGGLRSLYASMTPGGVELVQDPTLATAASIDAPPRDTPLALWAPIVAAGVAAALLAGRRG